MSYAEFERAATSLLAVGEKPGLEIIRKAIGGSLETIQQMLRRYWRELAVQVQSPAESLMRLPSEVADLADEIWQRALGLAAQSASHDDNAARERLDQVRRENDLRSHALAVKERTLNEREAQRDKAMAELQEQVATLIHRPPQYRDHRGVADRQNRCADRGRELSAALGQGYRARGR